MGIIAREPLSCCVSLDPPIIVDVSASWGESRAIGRASM
jgi:hypothetical protein